MDENQKQDHYVLHIKVHVGQNRWHFGTNHHKKDNTSQEYDHMTELRMEN